MPRMKKVVPTDLSVGELKRLLAVKERMDQLEDQKAKLEKELAQVNAGLDRLLGEEIGSRPTGRRKARKKAGKKRVTKKRGAKKQARKRVAKKTVRKAVRKTARKKAARKAVKKTARKAAKRTGRKTTKKRTAKKTVRKTGTAKKAAAAGKPTLEDVIEGLIRDNRKPLPFQTILATIQKKKLVKTKSKNFANVLRRTLSTSKRIRRAGRGIYDLA